MSEGSSQADRSVAGRIVVHLLFWGATGYLTLAMLGSMVVSLYGRPPAQEKTTSLSAKQRSWCVRWAAGLRDELDGQITLELQHPWNHREDPLARWRSWHEGWQDKLQQGVSFCSDAGDRALETAYVDLAAMRDDYHAALVKVCRVRRELRPRLDDALRQAKHWR